MRAAWARGESKTCRAISRCAGRQAVFFEAGAASSAPRQLSSDPSGAPPAWRLAVRQTRRLTGVPAGAISRA